MPKTDPAPAMTIRELRDFLDKGKDDYRIRSAHNTANQLCLRIYRHSWLDSIKETLFKSYRTRAQQARKAAHDGILAVLGQRIGGSASDTAFQQISRRLEDTTNDLTVRDLKEVLPKIDPDAETHVRIVSQVRGAWHGLVDQVGRETRKRPPDTLHTLQNRLAELQSAQKAIVACLRDLAEQDEQKNAISTGVPALLDFLSQQLEGGKQPVDFAAICALAEFPWPDKTEALHPDKQPMPDIGLLKSFADLLKTPSTEHLVQGAMHALTSELRSDNPASRAGSIPALVDALAAGSFRPASAAWRLGNPLRPDSHPGASEISVAASHKLLALLAIAQDPDCLDQSGHLKPHHTLAVIRGWTGPESACPVAIDHLTGIRWDKRTGRLQLGSAQSGSVDMKSIVAIREALCDNQQWAAAELHDLKLDLSSVPVPAVLPAFREAAVGDMHGNAVLFLHHLVQLGFADIKPGNEAAWMTLVGKIQANDPNDFSAHLAEVLTLKATDKKLVLLGDLLADRGVNDWFTLSLIEFLHDNGQAFDILFSNHDAAFVEYYLANKNKPASKHFVISEKATRLGVSPCPSLERLNKLLNKSPVQRAAFKQMAAKYLAHLKLVSCNATQDTLYAHAVVTEAMMTDMLDVCGSDKDAARKLPVFRKINLINDFFTETALDHVDSLREFFGSEEIERPSTGEPGPNPFHFTIWHRGPFPENELLDNEATHPYAAPRLVSGLRQAIHGHTEDIGSRSAQTVQWDKLITGIQDSLELLSDVGNPIDRTTDWLEAVLELAHVEARDSVLGWLMILTLAHYARHAQTPGELEWAGKINDFLQAAGELPEGDNRSSRRARLAAKTQLQSELHALLLGLSAARGPDGQQPATGVVARIVNGVSLSIQEANEALAEDLDAAERPSQLMKDMVIEELASEIPLPFIQLLNDKSSQAAAFRSLDDPFGKGDTDRHGRRLVFLG